MGVYVTFIAQMIPSIAFLVLNTPNDFISDFNRYPESFPTVSIIQYSKVAKDGISPAASIVNSESFVQANRVIRDTEII